MRVQHLLVGVDNSTDSRRALEWSVALTKQLGAELCIVHAVGLTDTGRAGTASEHERSPAVEVMGDVQANLDSTWSEPARSAEIRHRTLLEHGPPLLVIPRVAERLGVDLIVVGHRGSGGATTTLGSTSHGLLELGTTPVVCIPPP